jgi:ubiquinone/menaquinone biosynthesis C-methylase UbiE
MRQLDPVATAQTRSRYQRLSPLYDRMEGMAERRYHPWRERLWSLVNQPNILEVGVGTGKNMPYYPANARITAIDLTPGMLERAQKRATDLNLRLDLRLGDVQALEFPAASFDAVVATFVFCSVPDPVLGLEQIRRVLKPGGKVYLLEHMRSANPIVGIWMDILNPLVVGIMGANINRRTLDNVRQAGLELDVIEDLGMGGILLIAAKSHSV